MVTLSAAILLWFSWTFVIRIAFVSGNSMKPSLRPGQVLLLKVFPIWLKTPFQARDIVVLRSPQGLSQKRYVKRLLALPGDTLSIRQDGIYLNSVKQDRTLADRPDTFPDLVIAKGEVIALEGYPVSDLPAYLKSTLTMLLPLEEAIMEESLSQMIETVGTLKLTANHYFVLGDNPDYNASEDSRLFGPISRNDLLAMVTPL
ncbi:MAG: signal peptidase I [Trueperaceae bacterium]|nr:signal peptidase I [Trueperaceae bacterium]